MNTTEPIAQREVLSLFIRLGFLISKNYNNNLVLSRRRCTYEGEFRISYEESKLMSDGCPKLFKIGLENFQGSPKQLKRTDSSLENVPNVSIFSETS